MPSGSNDDSAEHEPTDEPTDQSASQPERTRIGLFGGTFDPIHIGHLMLCQEACYQLQLECIYLLPAADPPHKQDRHITPVQHRIAMLHAATSETNYLRISHIDVDRPGPHYSVDTIKRLREQFDPQTEIFFLIGLDSLRDLHTWYQPEWLLANCRIVSFERGGVQIRWADLEEKLPGIETSVQLLEMPELEISSSNIRHRVALNQPIRYFVPPAVEAYINKHHLYQTDNGITSSM